MQPTLMLQLFLPSLNIKPIITIEPAWEDIIRFKQTSDFRKTLIYCKIQGELHNQHCMSSFSKRLNLTNVHLGPGLQVKLPHHQAPHKTHALRTFHTVLLLINDHHLWKASPPSTTVSFNLLEMNIYVH